MLPDLSVLWVIFFVLLLTVVLDRLLFRPLLRVMEERQRAISSARELAERSANDARVAAAEFDRRTTEARAELYRQMDEMRRTAMAERAAILARTRAEAEAEIAAASMASCGARPNFRAVAITPVPIGLVRRSASPGRAPEFARIRAGSTSPVIA